MIAVWRIAKKKYAATAFSGEGSRLVGGRWNSPGTSLVYASATLSLAALETFVHMEIEDAGNLFMCIRADLPSDLPIEAMNEKQLPQDWYTIPAPKSLALIGDDWSASRRTAVLKVPSAIIRVEFNYLLNPLHADFSRINIQAAEPFVLDRRLWK